MENLIIPGLISLAVWIYIFRDSVIWLILGTIVLVAGFVVVGIAGLGFGGFVGACMVAVAASIVIEQAVKQLRNVS